MNKKYLQQYFPTWEEAEIHRRNQQITFKRSFIIIDDKDGHRVFPLQEARRMFPKMFRRSDYGKARS